jgi:hypothetical protein
MIGFVDADLIRVCALIVAIVAAGEALRRGWRGVKQAFSDAVDTSATGHLVRYHLGPNGTTPPIHQRVMDNQATELAHHKQNTELLTAIAARLTQVEKAQQAAAVAAEHVETERRNQGDTP